MTALKHFQGSTVSFSIYGFTFRLCPAEMFHACSMTGDKNHNDMTYMRGGAPKATV